MSNLIRLTSENQTALGLDSPWLVEVVMSKGMPIPPFVMESSVVGLAGPWTAVAPCGDMTWDIDGPSDFRRARPATEQEIRDHVLEPVPAETKPEPFANWQGVTSDVDIETAVKTVYAQPATKGEAKDGEVRYFSYGAGDFNEHATAEEARNSADDYLQDERDNAQDGWDECVHNICWGRILGQATQTETRECTPEEKEQYGFDEIWEFELIESEETFRCNLCGGLVQFDGTAPTIKSQKSGRETTESAELASLRTQLAERDRTIGRLRGALEVAVDAMKQMDHAAAKPCEDFSQSLKVGEAIGVSRTEITGDVLSPSGNGAAERPALPETLPDETAPTALADAVRPARVESDPMAQRGGSSRLNKRLNWGEEMAKSWQRGEFGNEPLIPAAKPQEAHVLEPLGEEKTPSGYDRVAPSHCSTVQPTEAAGGGESPMAKIIGKWPGDETDEEIQAALADMDRNPLEATVAELRTQLADALAERDSWKRSCDNYVADSANELEKALRLRDQIIEKLNEARTQLAERDAEVRRLREDRAVEGGVGGCPG